MKAKRTYDDGCAAAHALALVGDRWALLVVRELLLGPKRFTDLRAGLTSISPNVLTQRLEGLEKDAIVRRRKLPPPAAAWVYELTEWGLQLETVIEALGRWAARSPFLPEGKLNVDSLILSLRTMFDPHKADGLKATIELKIGDQRFRADIDRGRMRLVRGPAIDPDVIIEGDSESIASVVYAGRKLADALRAGDIEIVGDKSVARRFFGLFPLPARAPATA